MALNFPTSPANNQTYTYGSQTYTWLGQYGLWQASSLSLSNASSSSFTANGTQTTFTLTNSVSNQNNVIVTLDGVVQVPTTHYSISGTTLTFTSAPIANTTVEARSMEGMTVVGPSTVTVGKNIAIQLVFGG